MNTNLKGNKMYDLPCDICLLKPCCSYLCDKQIEFTAERFIRLSLYLNLKEGYERENKIFTTLMQKIWDTNQEITQRRSTPIDYNIKFHKYVKIISEKINNEKTGINDLFCILLFEKFDIR
jgi:hypothetical protein